MNKCGVTGWKGVLAAIAFAIISAPVSADIVATDEVLHRSDRERVRAFLDREAWKTGSRSWASLPSLPGNASMP